MYGTTESRMTFTCPSCNSTLQPRDLKNEWRNGIHCAICGAEVRYSPPYQHIILFGSSPFMVAALAVRGIERGFLASIMIVVVWFVGSIWLAGVISMVIPPKLKLANDGDEDPYNPPSIFKR
jgi:hypothetical protein